MTELKKITWKELEDRDYASVTDYCRVLIKEPKYPKTLEVYRGDMLCMTVDVDGAAKLDVKENKHTGPIFVKYKDKTMSAKTKARLALNRPKKGSRAAQGEV